MTDIFAGLLCRPPRKAYAEEELGPSRYLLEVSVNRVRSASSLRIQVEARSAMMLHAKMIPDALRVSSVPA